MEKSLKYEEPKLLELDAPLLQGGNGQYEDVSTAKFEASYNEEDAAHETMEF